MRRLAVVPGFRLFALGCALFLGGCAAVGPDYKRPETPSLTAWSGGSLATLADEQRGKPRAQTEDWWRNFNDPVLDALVAEAQRVNPNVRTAGMRILEARAQLGIASSLLYPQQQQVTGEILRKGTEASSGPDGTLTGYKLGFGVGWEIDFWGKFRRSIEAADAGYFASIAQYDDLQVLIAAQVASFYTTIRTLELRLRIAHENAALQKRSLEITERLFKHGNDSELDVQQARSQYLGTLATIPQIEGSLRQTQNALSILLSRPPGPLPEMAAGRGRIPQAELAIIADMPAEFLRRRPDVRAVEMQLAAQSALIGVSEADLYPSIALLGSLGVSGTSVSGSPRTFAWGVGPSLVWNVFDYGRLTNEVLVQDARFQQVYEQYQGVVLQAAREVDDAAAGFVANREQVPLLEGAVKAAQRSLEIANIQYREGSSSFERVLDSQRVLFNQQERLVNNLGNVSQSLVTLYKAMGGGWQQARARPLVDDATSEMMGKRSDWRDLLAAPLPPPDAAPPQIKSQKEQQ
jgi:NodT family efflux transporter outer membrane factor (OMF) lipoprotein